MRTTHFVPFRKFGRDLKEDALKDIREDIIKKIMCNKKEFLLQGDFNYNDVSLKSFLPEIFSDEVQEIILDEPTTVRNKRYEHIIYKGLKHLSSKVISDVLTDHFPIYSEFEI